MHLNDGIITTVTWSVDDETNIMGSKMTCCIGKVVKEILGQSKGNRLPTKNCWLYNEDF